MIMYYKQGLIGRLSKTLNHGKNLNFNSRLRSQPGNIDFKRTRARKALVILLICAMVIPAAVVSVSIWSSANTPHAPIVIVGDSDFITANGVTDGTGTSSDPYIIEGWEIDAEIAAGISISGTTAHFVIRNVNISRASPLPNQYGIYLNHVENGSIESSNISGGLAYGIYIFSQSSNISISNCNFEVSTHYNNQYNIYMRDSSLISLSGNTITSVSGYSSWGVIIWDSNNITMSGNVFANCSTSLLGYELGHFNTHSILIDNIVNGKPIYYYKNTTGTVIDGVAIGQLIMANCTDIAVSNLDVSDNDMSLTFAYVYGGTVEDCVISPRNYAGVYPYECTGLNFSGNRISNCSFGVFLEYCDDFTFYDNLFNSIASHGVFIRGADNLTFNANNVSEVTWGGAHFTSSTNCTITYNFFVNNRKGVEMSGCTGFLLHHNNFINTFIPAFDDNGAENSWDDGYPSGGNYWDDYVGTDDFNGPDQNISGSDGIGDIPYVIDGDSQDGYPLMEPIPEFDNLLVPLLGLMMIFVVMRVRARQNKER